MVVQSSPKGYRNKRTALFGKPPVFQEFVDMLFAPLLNRLKSTLGQSC